MVLQVIQFFSGLFKPKPKIQPMSTGPSAAVKVVGATGGVTALAAAFLLLIGPWEGDERVPYLDVGGIPTACKGITGPEVTQAYRTGRVFTDEECRALEDKAGQEHWDSVRRLITYRPLPYYTEVAFISFHWNVGPGQFASSTLRKKANAGDLRGACEELPRWTKVQGKVVKGLEKRRFLGDAERLSERTVCLIGVDPSFKTPLFEKLIMRMKK